MGLFIDRFLSRYKKVLSGCWEWTGTLNEPHPGLFYSRFWDGIKNVGAHRYSYEHFNKVKLHKNDCVCHSCDNPLCVNPDHLFLGTHKTNAEDRNKKGRQAFGAKNGAATITEEMAKRIIKELNGKRAGYKNIAERLGVSIYVVSKISRNKTWKHLLYW